MTTISPPLTLSVTNADGQPVLTIGDGLPINVLTVRLANTTGQPLALRGGTPAPDDRPDPAAASALSFNFGALLQKTQYDAIRISATRWTARQLGAPPAWTIAPDADMMLAAGDSLTFTITGVNVPVAPSGHLTIDYANFGIAGNGNVRAPLDCRQPPLTGAPMALSPSPSWIVADGQPNTLVLRVENTTSPLTSIGTSWGEVDAPKFSLLFVYDPEAQYPLTTADLAEDISVVPSKWAYDPRPSTGDDPVWTLRPETPPVLGTDAATLVETIAVSNIVSRLPPGKARITLQWSQIPGYANGEATTYIDKIAPLAITGLRCDPAWTLAGAPIHPTVHWDPVSGSPTSLELVGPDGRHVVDVTDTSHAYPTALSQPTTLTLHAEGPGGRQTEEHTAFDAVVFQTKLAVPLGQDGDQKAIVRRSHRWDVVYVGCFDDMGNVLNSAAYTIQIRDGTNGSRLAAIDASWSAKQNPVGMWQSPPVADGIDRLAVVGDAEIQIWDIGESHSATRRATIPAGGSQFLGFLPDGDLLIGTLNPDISVSLMSETFEMVRHDPLGSRPAVTVRTLTLDGPTLTCVLTLDAESLLSIVWKGVVDPNLKNPDEYYKQVAPVVVRKTRISDGVLVDEVSLGQWYLLGINNVGFSVLLAPAVDGSAYLFFRDSMTDLGLAPLPFGNNVPELVHFPMDGSGKATAHTIPEVASASQADGRIAPQPSPNGNDLVIAASGCLWIVPVGQPTAGVALKLGEPYAVEFSSGGDRLTVAVTDSNNMLATSIVELNRTVVSPSPEEPQ